MFIVCSQEGPSLKFDEIPITLTDISCGLPVTPCTSMLSQGNFRIHYFQLIIQHHIKIIIIIIVIIIISLQPFIGSWLLFHFLNRIHSRSLWTGYQPVTRPLPTHRTSQTQKKHADINVSSGIRTHDLSVWAHEDSSCLRPFGHFDRHYVKVKHIQINEWINKQ
jgi:hypothetical protein